MSLLKKTKRAKSKSELGKKINYVHDMITLQKLILVNRLISSH